MNIKKKGILLKVKNIITAINNPELNNEIKKKKFKNNK